MTFCDFIESKFGAWHWYTAPRPCKRGRYADHLYFSPKAYAALRAEFEAADA